MLPNCHTTLPALNIVKIDVIKQTEIFLLFFSETAYTSETTDLLFKRSVYDKMDDFFRYRINKRNVSVITLGKEEDGKHFACVNDSLHGQCQQRYSLRYINDTYVSFRLSNITLLDSGLYILEAFFAGIIPDPEYAVMYLTVQGNPSFKLICLSLYLFWAGTLQTWRRTEVTVLAL